MIDMTDISDINEARPDAEARVFRVRNRTAWHRIRLGMEILGWAVASLIVVGLLT